MTQFNADWKFPLLYPPINTENTLPEWISAKGLSQYHCAGITFANIFFQCLFSSFTLHVVTFYGRNGKVCPRDILL